MENKCDLDILDMSIFNKFHVFQNLTISFYIFGITVNKCISQSYIKCYNIYVINLVCSSSWPGAGVLAELVCQEILTR